MNNCVHLKKKINHSLECKKQMKIIKINECNNCIYKEYKLHCNSAKTNVKNQKCTIKTKKSAKLSKLERDRYSVFTKNKDKCMFCPRTHNLTWHEIFSGRNRQNSMKLGFCLRMCEKCHSEKQENKDFRDFWHVKGQLYFEEKIGSRNEFIEIFRESYIK